MPGYIPEREPPEENENESEHPIPTLTTLISFEKLQLTERPRGRPTLRREEVRIIQDSKHDIKSTNQKITRELRNQLRLREYS